MPVAELLEHLVGLQAQVPRDPYVSLWSRLEGFEAEALERLLLDRHAVRMTLMRTTIHLVTRRDVFPLRAATQAVCERGLGGSPFRRRLGDVELAPILALGTALVEERPRTIAELGSALGQRWPARDGEAMAYAVRYLVPLVQVTPRGLLHRSGPPRVTTVQAWLGDGITDPRVAADPDDLVLRYLRAFGPAAAADVRTWSGLTGVAGVLGRLRPRLRVYRDEAGRELFDVEDGVIAAPDAVAPVRFTGEYDNLYLSHADRSRITGDLAWGTAYARQGAFFVDGFLAGSWRLATSGTARDARVIELTARRSLARSEREAAVAEAERLLRLLAPGAIRRTVDWTPG